MYHDITNKCQHVINAPINVNPQGGGGGATHGKLTESTFPWVGILTFKRCQGREFDMAAILEGREKLEMSDLPS